MATKRTTAKMRETNIGGVCADQPGSRAKSPRGEGREVGEVSGRLATH